MHYTLGKLLNRGAYGAVFDGKRNEGKDVKDVVFKVILKEGAERSGKNLEHSYELECNDFARKNTHPNIVKIYDCLDCEKINDEKEACDNGVGSKIVILEKVKYTSVKYLNDVDGRPNLREIFLQIARGVKFLHDRDYFHTDLKLDNIMFNSLKSTPDIDDVKIIDLGTVSSTHVSLGTPGYQDYIQYDMSDTPENLIDKKYGKAIDIFQLGAIFYDITSNDYISPEENGYPNPYLIGAEGHEDLRSELVKKMTDKNYNTRITIDQVIEYLNDETIEI